MSDASPILTIPWISLHSTRQHALGSGISGAVPTQEPPVQTPSTRQSLPVSQELPSFKGCFSQSPFSGLQTPSEQNESSEEQSLAPIAVQVPLWQIFASKHLFSGIPQKMPSGIFLGWQLLEASSQLNSVQGSSLLSQTRASKLLTQKPLTQLSVPVQKSPSSQSESLPHSLTPSLRVGSPR